MEEAIVGVIFGGVLLILYLFIYLCISLSDKYNWPNYLDIIRYQPRYEMDMSQTRFPVLYFPPVTRAHFPPMQDESPSQNQIVSDICQTKGKDLAFGCGHMACKNCGSKLRNCHICRKRIKSRLRVFL